MPKRRANGEGNIRKRKDGRWEGRYTVGHDPETGKAIIKNVLGKTQAEGKEKRKKEPSKEGKIGVEGINDDILLELFKKANISSQPIVINNPLTSVDMFTLELSGTPNAKQNKKKLLKSLNLPEFLSTSSLISYINSSMTKDEFYKYCDNLFTNL